MWNIDRKIDYFRELKKKKIDCMNQDEQKSLEKIIFERYTEKKSVIVDYPAVVRLINNFQMNQKILEKYTKERNVIKYPMFENFIDDIAVMIVPDCWKDIGDYIKHKSAVVFFDRFETKDWYFFEDGNDIVELYDSLPPFDFYVTDLQGKYLLACNHSECLVAAGEAVQWMRNTKQYKEMLNESNSKDDAGCDDCSVTNEHWREYDKNGNEIYYKNSNGYKNWREYDEDGRLIHYKDSEGYEKWKEYDGNGRLIHHKDSNGCEYWKEYDENGEPISSKDSNGCESSTYSKDSNDSREWKKYNENSELIHRIYYEDSNRFEEWREYNENGEQIHYKCSDGYEKWQEYDEKGRLIHIKDDYGYEEWREYCEDSRKIHLKNSDYDEFWDEYDEHGNLIYRKELTGVEHRYEYDERGNETHYVQLCNRKNV